jgi:Asp-tRNA(Asn)/Glu-tRNA(Gln) amidotransferase A subunit family amidase
VSAEFTTYARLARRGSLACVWRCGPEGQLDRSERHERGQGLPQGRGDPDRWQNHRLVEVLRHFDVLLCPVFGRPALPRMDGGVRRERRIQVDDATVVHDEQLFWSGITCGFYLPGTVARLVRSQDGLPIGVQIVARPHDDRTTIAVASLIEALNGGFSPPPGWE